MVFCNELFIQGGKMKNKLFSLLLMVGILISGCSDKNSDSTEPNPTDQSSGVTENSNDNTPEIEEIKATITFSKDYERTQLYEQDENEVLEPTALNEDIFVFVEIEFNNIRDVTDTVSMVIELKPGTDSYDKYDFISGTQIPKTIEDDKIEMDDEGISYIIAFSGFNFKIVPDMVNTRHEFRFRIRAIKEISEPSEFRVIFGPRGGEGGFNDGRNKQFIKRHTTIKEQK